MNNSVNVSHALFILFSPVDITNLRSIMVAYKNWLGIALRVFLFGREFEKLLLIIYIYRRLIGLRWWSLNNKFIDLGPFETGNFRNLNGILWYEEIFFALVKIPNCLFVGDFLHS